MMTWEDALEELENWAYDGIVDLAVSSKERKAAYTKTDEWVAIIREAIATRDLEIAQRGGNPSLDYRTP